MDGWRGSDIPKCSAVDLPPMFVPSVMIHWQTWGQSLRAGWPTSAGDGRPRKGPATHAATGCDWHADVTDGEAKVKRVIWAELSEGL